MEMIQYPAIAVDAAASVAADHAVGSIGVGCVQLGELSKMARDRYAVNKHG